MSDESKTRAKRRLAWSAAVLVAVAAVASVAALTDALRWRLQVVASKALGQIEDITWSELMAWLPPGSPLYLEPLRYEPNPFAGLHNPYTTDEDKRAGRELFVQYCSSCHGTNGEGQSAPGLIDRPFKMGDSDWALFRTVTRGLPDVAMPPIQIAPKEAWQVLAYVGQIRAAAAARPAAEIQFAFPASELTSERLEAAASEPQNWLTHSGTYDSWRHSALAQVDTTNVADLKLAWAAQLRTAASVETSPIVVDGVMYLSEPPSNVLAIDAASGRTLWTHRRNVPNDVPACCGRVNRGVAVLDGKVVISTLDNILVALDARTGEVVWQKTIADYRVGYTSTAAPLAVRDLIIVGIAGGDYGTRGFIDAYDVATGERRWRFDTIPPPGTPGAETWGGDSWLTGGGATWVTGSYDPELELVYWGVGNPAPDFDGDSRPGDNLFTNSVVALEIETGRLAWYFQFTPHDEHDWDSNQIPVLLDAEYAGRARRLMLWANRNGFYYVLDRETGEFLNARAYVKQNWADSIDEKGRPVLSEHGAPTSRGTLTWPGVYGGANWWSPSYSPQTDSFYVVPIESPRIFFKGVGSGASEYHEGNLLLGGAVVETGEPMAASVRALDPLTGELRWEHALSPRRSISEVGGVLTTAGNLVFVGDRSDFLALDARTGTELWRVSLGGPINANPIAYSVDDRQMIAITAGTVLYAFRL